MAPAILDHQRKCVLHFTSTCVHK